MYTDTDTQIHTYIWIYIYRGEAEQARRTFTTWVFYFLRVRSIDLFKFVYFGSENPSRDWTKKKSKYSLAFCIDDWEFLRLIFDRLWDLKEIR